MSCETRTEVLLIDDGDKSTLTLSRLEEPDEGGALWALRGPSGPAVHVSSGDLAEFVYAVRDLIADDLPGPDPFMAPEDR